MRFKRGRRPLIYTFAFLVFMLGGCSTVHFVNGPEMDDTVVREVWHHTAIYGLVEVSPPINIHYVCDDKQWDTITVEKTFMNNLATLASGYYTFYSPWAVYYECRENID